MTEPVIDVHLDDGYVDAALRRDVRAGLAAVPKSLPARWFYDATGSELFDKITLLPEYYPTRAERAALGAHVGEIAAVSRARSLVELGSGSSEKTRLLLGALRAGGMLREFVPLDVSATALRSAAAAIATEYPGLAVHGVVGDFTEHLDRLPGTAPRLVAFLGGTIGNFVPAERGTLLGGIRNVLRPGEWLLLGTDLVKDPQTLVAAYDDQAGVTAEFNRNVLRVLNRELGADFDLDAFEHVAVWDAVHEWIEMRLRATRPMRVRVPLAGMMVEFAGGEQLRTEISAKFRRDGVAGELAAAGFELRRWWTDPDGLFGLSLSRAA